MNEETGFTNISQLTDAQLRILKSRLKEAHEKRYLDSCKQRLTKIITKKMQTIMIGALAAFEESFGFLWGYKKDNNNQKLTQEEKEMFDLWLSTRTKILDNGNGQIRASQNEIANHVVSWNRYHIEFKVISEE